MTKLAPHKALMLISFGKLTFDERVVLHRVATDFAPRRQRLSLRRPSFWFDDGMGLKNSGELLSTRIQKHPKTSMSGKNIDFGTGKIIAD